MTALRSQFVAAVMGGIVVAGAFLVLGITGRRSTETIVEQSPVSESASASQADNLTPHAIYARDAPGVVLVKSLDQQDEADPFDLYPQRSQGSTTGSGFLVNPRGYILTSYHLIEGADRSTGIRVQFEDNLARPATVVGGDERDDLAVLKVSMRGVAAVKPLTLGDSVVGPGRRPNPRDRRPVWLRTHAVKRDRVRAPAPDLGSGRVRHQQRDSDRHTA